MKTKITVKQLLASGPLQIHFIWLIRDTCRHTYRVHAKKHVHSRRHPRNTHAHTSVINFRGFHTNKNILCELHIGNLSFSHNLAAFFFFKYQSFAQIWQSELQLWKDTKYSLAETLLALSEVSYTGRNRQRVRKSRGHCTRQLKEKCVSDGRWLQNQCFWTAK